MSTTENTTQSRETYNEDEDIERALEAPERVGASEEGEREGEEPELSFFEDEDDYFGAISKKRYTTKIQMGPMTFFAIEAPAEVAANYKRDSNLAAKLLKRLEGKQARVAKIKDDDEREVAAAALEREVEEALCSQVTANERLIEACVSDWANPKWPRKRPCNTESRRKLSASVKAELADRIMQKSLTGRSNASYLQ